MAIINSDIKIFQSQDNTDNDSGGGSRTSVEVVGGEVNNLFPDISRIDTTSGDVAMRKVFPTVYTQNRDVYYGAHAIIRKPPSDPKVSALLFHSDDPHDVRGEARDKIESYVTASYETGFYLFGNQVEGSRSITFLQTTTGEIPSVGEVYLLKDESSGVEQYVRISSIDTTRVSLTYSSGSSFIEYTRMRIICVIEQPLKFPFSGSEFYPGGRVEGSAITYFTQVSDAAKFYGVRSLVSPAASGDLSLKVDSIYEYLAPSSRKHSPLINLPWTGSTAVTIESPHLVYRDGPDASVTKGWSIQFPDSIVPGTLAFYSSYPYTDNGRGELIRISDGTVVATIDYLQGRFELVGNGISISPYSFNYQVMASYDLQKSITLADSITSSNQGLVYTKVLNPSPSIMNLTVDYRTGGKWYRMSLNGDYSVGTDPSVGVGTVSNNGDGTSTISLTLGGLPDIESDIIYSWGSAEGFNELSVLEGDLYGGLTNAPPLSSRWMEVDLGYTDIDPLSFSFSISNGSLSSTLTCGPDGSLIDTKSSSSGDPIVGRLDFEGGILMIEKPAGRIYSRWPSTDTLVDYSFDYWSPSPGEPGDWNRVQVDTVATSGAPTLALQVQGPIIPETLKIRMFVAMPVPINYATYNTRRAKQVVELFCDANGDLKSSGRTGSSYALLVNHGITGTLNAVTGDIVLTMPSFDIARPFLNGRGFTMETVYPSLLTMPTGLEFTYRSELPSAQMVKTNVTVQKTMDDDWRYKIQIPPNVDGDFGFTFVKADSTSSKNHIYSVGDDVYSAGTQIGTVDRDKGLVTMEVFDHANGRLPLDMEISFTKLVMNTVYTAVNTSSVTTDAVIPAGEEVVFNTSVTNLVIGSVQLRFIAAGESLARVISGNDDGTFNYDSAVSSASCNFTTGVVKIVFSRDIISDSLKYDAVAETLVPVNPGLLGLDPVRLPVDGRVPVFDEGRHLVVFNEELTPTAASAGTTVTLSRQGVSHIEVVDDGGRRLANDQYVSDLIAGTVTFNDPISTVDNYGNTLTPPYNIVDRVEDMIVANNVQVDGTITLSSPLSNDHSTGAMVASALVWGDVGARVYNVFSQEIWSLGNPVWSDNLIGDPTTAQYNLINYPIQIDNANSVSGRWAIIFKSSTTVDVVEEKMGVVKTGVAIAVEDVAPINPATNQPYFVMLSGGFGSGWVTNNVIRLNTDSGDANMWVIRTVQPGALTQEADSIEIETRGDVA